MNPSSQFTQFQPSGNQPIGVVSPTPSHKKFWIVLIIVAIATVGIIAAGVFLWKQGQTPRTVSGQHNINLVIEDSKRAKPSVIKVAYGEPVNIVVNAKNQHDELGILIPAYDISTTFSQNSVGNIEFVANKKGMSPIFLRDEDGKQTQVGKVVVE